MDLWEVYKASKLGYCGDLYEMLLRRAIRQAREKGKAEKGENEPNDKVEERINSNAPDNVSNMR